MKRTLLMALTLLGLASGVLAQSERSYDNASAVVTYSSDNTLSDNLQDLNDWLNNAGAYTDGGGFGDWLIDNNLDGFFDYFFVVESDPFFDEMFGYRLIKVRAFVDGEEIIIPEDDYRIIDGIFQCYYGPNGPGAGRIEIGGGAYENTFGSAEQFPVNDPLFLAGRQKNLTNANFPAAWASNATSSPAVNIGIIDTGWENGTILSPFGFTAHEDLVGKVANEINFTGFLGLFNAADVDPLSHGTRVAGLAGASTNNGLGIASTGYDSNLTILKVANFSSPNANQTGAIPFFNTFLALFFGHTFFGCNILNVSSTYTIPAPFIFLGDIVLNWVTRGNGPGGSGLPPSLVVAASGTTFADNAPAGNTLLWPGSRPQVMAVGGTNNVSGKFANGELIERFLNNSRLGAKVEASAAGASLVSTERYNLFLVGGFPWPYIGDFSGYTAAGNGFPNFATFDFAQGTSFAAPQVSGLAATLWTFASNPFDVPSLNVNPFSMADFVRARVGRNTDMVMPTAGGRTAAVNTGRINAGRTVAYVDRILMPTQSVATARLGTNINARVVLDRAYLTAQRVTITSTNAGLARPKVTTVTVPAGQTQATFGITINKTFNVAAPLNNRQKVEIKATFRGTTQVGQLYVVR